MEHIRQFHQPKLSIWQSAVDEAVAKRREAEAPAAMRMARGSEPVLRPDASHAAVREAAEYCQAQASSDLSAAPGAGGIADTFCFCSRAALRLAESKILCDEAACQRYKDDLAKFGECDPLYADAAVKYAEYFIAQCKTIPYRIYDSLSDFVVDGRLPSKARVAVLGDWGTGQDAALNVLRQIAAKRPDAVIHLGDIYYSGTAFEDQNYFYVPWSEILRLADAKIPTFTMSGNHDMYSGGGGYYDLIDQLGQGASYFCLRNDHWQFLALDTGLHDANPSWNGAAATYLEDSELAWHQDKIERADGRRTVLMSHHPLFTANENIDGGPVNLRLFAQLRPLLSKADLWLWGHEHNFVVYDPYLGVARARCLGHAAFPVSVDEQPSAPRFPEVPVRTRNSTGRDITLGSTAGMMNHGYAIMDLDGPTALIRYYQDSSETEPLFEESIP